MHPKGTQNASWAPCLSITQPVIALANAPPKGMPAITQARVSVICAGGTAVSATPYAETISGAIAKPLKNSAIAKKVKFVTKIRGKERAVRAAKNIKKRVA